MILVHFTILNSEFFPQTYFSYTDNFANQIFVFYLAITFLSSPDFKWQRLVLYCFYNAFDYVKFNIRLTKTFTHKIYRAYIFLLMKVKEVSGRWKFWPMSVSYAWFGNPVDGTLTYRSSNSGSSPYPGWYISLQFVIDL